MCKIMAMAGIAPGKHEAAWKLIIAARTPMTVNDKDGYGYAAVTHTGSLVAERWLDPKQAFKVRGELSGKDAEIQAAYKALLTAPVAYNRHGAPVPGVSSIIAHSRMATCGKGLSNTHPFISGNTALIHNGVVRGDNSLMKTSTCDSEIILGEYLQNNVSERVEGIGEATMGLFGSFACAVLTRDANNLWVMDIFRNTGSRLVAAYVQQLDTVVFCTTEEILREACRKVKFKLGTVFTVEPGNLIRHSVETGEPMVAAEFEPNSMASVIEYGSWTNQRDAAVSLSAARNTTLAESLAADRAADAAYLSEPHYYRSEE